MRLAGDTGRRVMGSIVKGVDFVTVPTQDIGRAIAFYRDVLELEAGPTWGGDDGTPPIGAEFETGAVTLALLNAAAVGQEFSPHKLPVAFHVDDVEAAKATLQERGVTFVGQEFSPHKLPVAFHVDDVEAAKATLQ